MVIAMRHLMGTAEIAQRLGVSRQRVQQLAARPDWPKPYDELTLGKVWRIPDIEAWIAEHRPDIAHQQPAPDTSPVRRGRGRWHPEETPRPTKRTRGAGPQSATPPDDQPTSTSSN